MRILLVDDEMRLLDSTRRAIRLERPTWTVFTACGGEEALQVLQDRQIDVLVTDMLMPGMGGAALLRRARQLSPGTVRLILSGHAGRDLIQSCEGSFHQFLGKPVDPDAFIRVIESFEIAHEDLKTSSARRLVAGLERVPSLPSLYAELAHLLTEPDPSLEAVGRIVRRDLGMASKVLKLANSCYISSERKVNDFCQALDLLNLEVLKQAVLVHGALEVARELQPSGLDLTGLWEHSAAVGRAAATLAGPAGRVLLLFGRATARHRPGGAGRRIRAGLPGLPGSGANRAVPPFPGGAGGLWHRPPGRGRGASPPLGAGPRPLPGGGLPPRPPVRYQRGLPLPGCADGGCLVLPQPSGQSLFGWPGGGSARPSRHFPALDRHPGRRPSESPAFPLVRSRHAATCPVCR